jgi:hypothetical protein
MERLFSPSLHGALYLRNLYNVYLFALFFKDTGTSSSTLSVTMVTMGGDLQPGCFADRLLTGLGQPQINS